MFRYFAHRLTNLMFHILGFFQDLRHAVLVQGYEQWEHQQGQALSERFLEAYVEGGERALAQASHSLQD